MSGRSKRRRQRLRIGRIGPHVVGKENGGGKKSEMYPRGSVIYRASIAPIRYLPPTLFPRLQT